MHARKSSGFDPATFILPGVSLHPTSPEDWKLLVNFAVESHEDRSIAAKKPWLIATRNVQVTLGWAANQPRFLLDYPRGAK